MKYKIVVSDFDGTLLRSDGTVSKRSVKTIDRFIKAGGTFLIATGRMHSSIKARLIDVGLDKIDFPLISYQGGLVKTSVSDKTILHKPVSNIDAINVLKDLEEQNLFTQTYIDEKLYIERPNPYTNYYQNILRIEAIKVGRLSEFLKANGSDPMKIVTFCKRSLAEGLVNRLSERYGSTLTILTSHSTMVEAFNNQSGKHSAVEYVANSMGLTLNDCICIGDECNDYEMVQKAGLGVAVGNAVKKLKSVANFVTDTNDNDGVAKVIEEFCLA